MLLRYYLNRDSLPEQKKEYKTNGSFGGPKYDILVTLLAARNPNSLHVTLAWKQAIEIIINSIFQRPLGNLYKISPFKSF
jgi:hypothetical protein